MAINAITLLEKPGGRRDLARRAIQSNFPIDLINGTNLFSNINDNLYMSNILINNIKLLILFINYFFNTFIRYALFELLLIYMYYPYMNFYMHIVRQ